MDANLLERVLKLAAKTGDRVIVVDPDSAKAFAVLPFETYEKLADGSVGLQALKEEDGEECEICEELGIDPGDLSGISSPAETASPAPETKPVTSQEIEKKLAEDITAWNLAKQSEKEAAEPLPLDILDDEANEEQYYLEPIE